MKYFIVLCLSLSTLFVSGQVKNLNLNNALVVAQLDKVEERFALEGVVATILEDCNVLARPSMNYIPTGGSALILVQDSLQNVLKAEGIDTYVVVSVRGYDRRYKPSERHDSLSVKLDQGSLHEIYRLDAVSVSFEFTFYRNGQYVGSDIIKCGNISDRESVLKRLRKKLTKRVLKKWS